MDQELKNYVQAQRKAGASDEQIKKILLETGWDDNSVNDALTSTQSTNQPENTEDLPVEPAKSSSPGLTPKINTSKKLLPILLVVLVVLLIGGGTWAYFKYFPKMSPEEILIESLEKTNELSSYEFDAEINADITIPKKELEMVKSMSPITSGNIDFLMSGAAHKTDEKLEGDFTLKLVNEDTTIIQFQEKIKDYTIYYKLDSLNIPLINLFVDLTPLTKNWIKLSSENILPNENGKATPNDQDILKKYMTSISEIEDEIDYHKLYSLENVFEDEVINNVNTHHYQIALNKDEASMVVEKVVNKMMQEFSQETPTEDIQKDLNTFKEQFHKIKIPTIDVWIGTEDFYIHQMYMNFKLSDLNIKQLNEIVNPNDTIAFKMNLKNFNNAPEITTPENTITIDELMEEFGTNVFGGFMNGPNETGYGINADGSIDLPHQSGTDSPKEDPLPPTTSPPLDEIRLFDDAASEVVNEESVSDPTKDSDNDGLSDIEEQKYNTDPNNADTDEDGFTDGQEVKNGYNPNGSGKLR